MKSLRIAEFCETGSGGTPSRARYDEFYQGGTIAWVKSGELSSGEVEKTQEFITPSAVSNSSTKLLKPGAILIAMYGATVGQVAVLRIQAATNQAVCHILPDSRICNARYLYWFLRSSKQTLLSLRVGGGQPNISQAIVRDLRVPLPPLEEQNRIAALLDKAEALRRKRQEALRLTDDFLRSTFLDLFGDPATNPKGWPVVKASKLFADKPRLGTTRPATGKGYLVVRVGEIGTESVNFAKCGRVEQTPEELNRFLLNKGDILIARAIGSRDQLGKCSYFDGHEELVVNDSHVMRLRPDPASCHPYWFYFLLSSPAGRQLVQGKGGATAVQFNINAAQISDLDVPLPPVTLQNQFVSRDAILTQP